MLKFLGLLCVCDDLKYIDKMAIKYKFAANATKELYNKLGTLPKFFNPYNRTALEDVAPTVTTVCGCPCTSSTILVKCSDYNIRRLTPKEYWRIMGFPESMYKAAAGAGVTDNQLYKQAGNSIAVEVIYYIIEQLYNAVPLLFNNLQVVSLFSGIGAFEAGITKFYLERKVGSWKLVRFCEIDKFAEQSYCAMYNVTPELNLGDVSKVNTKDIPDFDMLLGGSPCTDFSSIGKKAGVFWHCMNCDYTYNPLDCAWETRSSCPKCGSQLINKTRSSLLVEYLRVLREKKPKVALYENVKNIVSNQFKGAFDSFVSELDDYGYNVYWAILNAKDYGLPQNRERLYMVLIDKEYDTGKFIFPTPVPLKRKLSDLIEPEENIDAKFYLSK